MAHLTQDTHNNKIFFKEFLYNLVLFNFTSSLRNARKLWSVSVSYGQTVLFFQIPFNQGSVSNDMTKAAG